MRRICNERGFTLIELLVALVVGMFVLAATIGLVTINQRTHFVQEQVVDAQQHARIALDMIARDLRMAGYDPKATDTFTTTVPQDTVSPSAATTFTLKADFNENGVLDAGETVIYAFSGGSGGQITRNGVAVTPPNTVNGFELKTNTLGTLGAPGSITRVTLTITTRTANEDPYFTDTTGTFGVNVTGTTSDGTARLRRLSTTVTLRNI